VTLLAANPATSSATSNSNSASLVQATNPTTPARRVGTPGGVTHSSSRPTPTPSPPSHRAKESKMTS
jgi:hypothetical protein